jgi:hypothetical protein
MAKRAQRGCGEREGGWNMQSWNSRERGKINWRELSNFGDVEDVWGYLVL